MNDNVLEQIIDHAARVFPSEACGLIVNSGYGLNVIECANQSHEPGRSFLIDPIVYAAHADHIAAVYHSHPNRSPEPSEADIASAERCNVPFVIVGYPSEEIFTYTPKGILPAPYEGRHFVYGVMDCLSLVSDYYRHELGIMINDGERKQWQWWLDVAHQHAFVNGFIAQGFAVVTEPQVNDLVIMTTGGGPCPNHVAIYMGDSRILHHPSPSAPSRLEMYGQYWRQATYCYLRYTAPVQRGAEAQVLSGVEA
jgi:proteasome lid subunit RPN8/RPN11